MRIDWYLIKRGLRLWWQRRTRGWSDDETWNLEHTAAKWLLPRLKRFKELNIAHPVELTADDWDDILDKIIFSLEHVGCEDSWWGDLDDWTQEKQDRIQEGLTLLGKWWMDLWW
jgi:hypothetical protein